MADEFAEAAKLLLRYDRRKVLENYPLADEMYESTIQVVQSAPELRQEASAIREIYDRALDLAPSQRVAPASEIKKLVNALVPSFARVAFNDSAPSPLYFLIVYGYMTAEKLLLPLPEEPCQDQLQELGIVISNRSQIHLHAGHVKMALQDSIKAIAIYPTFLKAYHRAIKACVRMGLKSVASQVYELGLARAGGGDVVDFTSLRVEFLPPFQAILSKHLDLSTVQLEPTDPRIDKALRSPVLNHVGLPIAVFRIPNGGSADNQLATYLMIDKASGFAPPPFQNAVGPVLVLRKDFVSLTKDEVYGLWDFFCVALDRYADDKTSGKWMDRNYFINWQFSYNSQQQQLAQELPKLTGGGSSKIELLKPTKAEQEEWDNGEA